MDFPFSGPPLTCVAHGAGYHAGTTIELRENSAMGSGEQGAQMGSVQAYHNDACIKSASI